MFNRFRAVILPNHRFVKISLPSRQTGNPKDCRFAFGELILTNQRFGKITGVGNRLSKRKKRLRFLPFTFLTDLGNKQPPFVEVTEGGIFMSIKWNLSNCSSYLDLQSLSTRYFDYLSCNHSCLLTCKEQNSFCYILWLN